MKKPPKEDHAGEIRDAESLFCSKSISEIRNAEVTTRKEIDKKKEELRQLVGKSYRDLIESADFIGLMKSTCESICSNISNIDFGIRSLPPSSTTPKMHLNSHRVKVYGVASRVKYLVDTSENIWGCLDESMFLEASRRYLRARVVHGLMMNCNTNRDLLSNFPLLRHQWQIVESFKVQISQRSRERLLDRDLGIGSYADALAAVATIDELDPKQILVLFLESRSSWISRKLRAVSENDDSYSVSLVFCDVVRIIQVSLGQVGELFLQVLNDMPLFHKTVLGLPPGSQLFGGIPNPEEEVQLWKLQREKLESLMVILDGEFVSQSCSTWLKKCGAEIMGRINGNYLVDAMRSGESLASSEKLIRNAIDGRESMEETVEWLKNVFGSHIELPWNHIRELVLKDDTDLWDAIFEDAFITRMKDIIDLGFNDLSKCIDLVGSIRAIGANVHDFHEYLKRPSTVGAVWFLETGHPKTALLSNYKASNDGDDLHHCLNAYLGPEVSQIRDSLDQRCESILDDLLCFLDSPKSTSRMKEIASYIQDRCYVSMSSILETLEDELSHLSSALFSAKQQSDSIPQAIIVERSLFIGRLLFALLNHMNHMPLILGSPKLWLNKKTTQMGKSSSLSRQSYLTLDSPKIAISRRHVFDIPKKHASSSNAASLLGVDDIANPNHDKLNKTLKDLYIKAHDLWIFWISEGLSILLSEGLLKDDTLSLVIPLKGWEETILKQEQSNEGPIEMKISLPYMPSLYITSFLFQACQEIHKIGGHVVDRSILQNFTIKLQEKVLGVYSGFISNSEFCTHVSDKGVLQILFDLRFIADIISGGRDTSVNSDLKSKDAAKGLLTKSLNIRNNLQGQSNVASLGQTLRLIQSLSQKLDPIDWATYESYLWENEKQAYQRYAVLFGFLVQLNRMYTDTVQKLPSNAESNILRCSTVPRFKYLPISAPALSSRGNIVTSLPTSAEDKASRNTWKSFSTGEVSSKFELDDASSFASATPLLKSFMTQVGSKFGESTLKLGSMLTDGQVGRLNMLPVHAAGLLSSFTTSLSDS